MILNRRARPKTYHEISRPNTLQKSAKRIASMANSLKREPPSTACIQHVHRQLEYNQFKFVTASSDQ